eukprot:CAMPEP_0203967426 /NCGR_PEP_ID=MMETSP0359-20131031/96423_1 /ASSEMBLY_ACC=CAM_ASM_000338 /TAXON_ID=268821 /ORGANISM="Scrippsiella Hangoei, Strain SHTV-5" /LENGTH=137 /DNA_ID=CAMNT_0050905315 /DNA_START=62 /DNA_END=475 /DNA_ORIENTATION=-
MARVDAQEFERLLDVDDFLPDTEVPSVSPPQPRALAGRAAAAGVVALGLLACLALACLEFHAARPRSVAAPELEMTDMHDVVGLSFGSTACCEGGCDQCVNCGDTPKQQLSQDQCYQSSGHWCACSCSSSGSSCSAA